MPLVLYGTVTVLPTDFTGCQRSGAVGAVELETKSPQSEMSARSYTVYEDCNQNAAMKEVRMASKADAAPGACV